MTIKPIKQGIAATKSNILQRNWLFRLGFPLRPPKETKADKMIDANTSIVVAVEYKVDIV